MEGSRGGGSVHEREKGSKNSSSSSTSGGRWWRRWINAARYVVALALTVVTMVVIVYAFKVEFREKQLEVTVKNGFVLVSKPPAAKSSKVVSLTLTVDAFNPSGHGRVFFTDVWAYLAANNKSGMSNIFIATPIKFGATVQPQLYRVIYITMNMTAENPSYRDYYDKLSSSNLSIIIPNAALRLEGTLRTEAYLGHETPGRSVVYCCPDITIGIAIAADSTDVPCKMQKASIDEQPDATLLQCVPIN
uniref:Late embryogenesis abundant protein LEA-2 subgroup domain-containing protein n=1 Tax=Oryza nivara TaxID=4536 RepID=A0A0E0HK42_ORYNI